MWEVGSREVRTHESLNDEERDKGNFIMSKQNMGEQVEALFATIPKAEIESTVAGSAEFPISADVAVFLQVQPGDYFAVSGGSALLMRPQEQGGAVCVGRISGDDDGS